MIMQWKWQIFKGLALIDRVPEELWTEEPGGLQSVGLQGVGHD